MFGFAGREEFGGVVWRGAKLLHAIAEIVVPRVTLITRKAYGGANIAMNSRSLGASCVLAWEGAQIDVTGSQSAVRLLHRKTLAAADPNTRAALEKELTAEYEAQHGHVEDAVSAGAINHVIEPHQTRPAMVAALSNSRMTPPPPGMLQKAMQNSPSELDSGTGGSADLRNAVAPHDAHDRPLQDASSTEVHLWSIDLSDSGPLETRSHDEEEGRRADGFHKSQDRHRFLGGRLLLRAALGHTHNVEPNSIRFDSACKCGRSHGKPRPIGLPSEVSISHSGDAVLVGVSDNLIGVDVERISQSEDLFGLGDLIRHPLEPKPTRTWEVYGYWCRKEAVSKATGTGLNLPFSEIHVTAPREPAQLLSYRGRHVPCQFFEPESGQFNAAEDYFASVAVLTYRPIEVTHHRGTYLPSSGQIVERAV